jgi:hypothetical protein
MNRCSNCHNEYEESDLFYSERRDMQFCMKCKVTYGKNREGFAFMQGMEVLVPGFHSASDGRVFIVRSIFINSNCESGRLAYLVDKETDRPMKGFLDVNWLKLPEDGNNK